jgi:predicted ATP-grasp superfamily ATP-dependent carboligase
LPRDGSWLCKPLASAGGSRIRPWIDGPPTFGLEAPAYFQQRIEGMPVGAVFLAAGRRAHLLGVTRQLIGLDWCGLPADAAHRFRYCGSIGPLRLNSATANRFARIGDVLAEAFDLRGLFGVDAIVAGGDLAAGRSDVWPLEVNPRYTASVEVLERALGIRSIALHVAAFGGLPCATGSASVSMGADRRAAAAAEPVAHGGLADRLDDARPCCGKAILFACSDIIVGLKFPACCARRNSNCAWPTMADIPAAGSSIRAGQPVVTVLASGANEAAVLAKLKSSAELARAELAGTGACAAG